MESHDDGIFSLLRHLVPPRNKSDDIEQSPAQGGITVEGFVWSDSLSVRQRADGAFQLLHCGLNT